LTDGIISVEEILGSVRCVGNAFPLNCYVGNLTSEVIRRNT